MGHDGHTLFVGNMDQLFNGFLIQSRLCKYTKMIEVHKARDHDLNKIRTLLPLPHNQLRIFLQIVILQADKAAVMTLQGKGCKWSLIGNAVFGRKGSCQCANAPAVSAVP